MMKTTLRISAALLMLGGILAAARPGKAPAPSAAGIRPELEYLKAVNAVRPPQDPQVLFLLMGQYANANRHREGAEFLAARLEEFEPQLTDDQMALYLSAIGVLRAGGAGEVSFFQRIGWVKETIAILERAKRLSRGEVFVVRWMSGVVYAQLPRIFNRHTAGLYDLLWCLEHADQAPQPEWLPEVHYRLAVLYDRSGEKTKAREHLRLSGLKSLDEPGTLLTAFSEDPATGHTFTRKRIAELIPGKLYALSGYEFTEFYFLVSDDGRELIAIDAGTRNDSARAAWEALRAHAPKLPPLTTVLVTHSHWDHVGGHRFFRSLGPGVHFYARDNYAEQIRRGEDGPRNLTHLFFGSRFRQEDVRSFRPDVTISRRTELSIGGTRLDLIPIAGGETEDAMFIHLPDHGVLFAGDFLMPYLGAPFIEEGNLPGLLEAIDVAVGLDPKFLLHGHEPLTRIFSSTAVIAEVKTHYAWLQEKVLEAIRRGDSRTAIQQANLIPPTLLTGDPAAHLPYLVIRANAINRIYDQNVGYWQADLQGLDHLGRGDRGALLVDYLEVSEAQLAAAAKRMIAEGDFELAATTLDSTRDRFPDSGRLKDLERQTYRKLMEKYQSFDPFKFILYSGKLAEVR